MSKMNNNKKKKKQMKILTHLQNNTWIKLATVLLKIEKNWKKDVFPF